MRKHIMQACVLQKRTIRKMSVTKESMQRTAVQKITLLLLAVCFTSACNADTEQGISVPESDVLDYQTGAIGESVVNTPYSALIRVTSVDITHLPDEDKSDEYSEQKFTYHADVIETYRGESKKSITYVMYAEGAEQPGSHEKPFIITLCHDDEGFYWPGVGSEFLAHSKLKVLAKKAAKKADKKQVEFFLCD